MFDYKPASAEQFGQFLQMIWDDCHDYLQLTLQVMQVSWEEFKHRFRTRGIVCVIYQDNEPVGYYWIEECERILHFDFMQKSLAPQFT